MPAASEPRTPGRWLPLLAILLLALTARRSPVGVRGGAGRQRDQEATAAS
ncbi:hypothetical protein HJ590_12620 [Naumannella sp. ID2617S]|nr:hypothetical protein [Naumannella sp. ID2617S]